MVLALPSWSATATTSQAGSACTALSAGPLSRSLAPRAATWLEPPLRTSGAYGTSWPHSRRRTSVSSRVCLGLEVRPVRKEAALRSPASLPTMSRSRSRASLTWGSTLATSRCSSMRNCWNCGRPRVRTLPRPHWSRPASRPSALRRTPRGRSRRWIGSSSSWWKRKNAWGGLGLGSCAAGRGKSLAAGARLQA